MCRFGAKWGLLMGRFDRWARQSGRLRPVPVLISAGVIIVLSVGCGGGAEPFVLPPPPPPAPDFVINFSSPTVSVSQGSTSSAVNVSITPQNGFSGDVQVSLSGLPPGVTANPSGTFTVGVGTSAPVLFSASNNATTGTVNITATGTSENLTHTTGLGLTVQAVTGPPLPRSSFVRTNSSASLDNPLGEPHRRHMILDAAHQHLFVANRAKNCVEVISNLDGSNVAEINVPGAASADISPDGKTIWVGSATQAIYEVDVASLQVRAVHVVAGLMPLTQKVFDRPEEVLAMSSGKAMVRLLHPATTESLLASWDAATNSLADLTSTAPQVFQNGLGVMAKSGDGSRLFVAAADSSGEVALFDGNGSLLAGPQTIGGGNILLAAASKAGTRFAVLFEGGSGTQVELFDPSLNSLGTYNAANAAGLVFSPDSAAVYVSEQFGNGFVVSLLDGNNLHFVGRVSDVAISGVQTQLEESDATRLLFGLANRGVSFVDAAATSTLSQNAPAFSTAPVAQPSGGPNSGNTSAILTGSNFENGPRVQFGSQSATVQGGSATQVQVTSPASAASGAVNIAAFFSDGWNAVAPDAFSYGPQILELLPNAGNKNGNEIVSLYGYGFGADASKLTVKIGGVASTVQKIEQIASIAPALGLDAAFPFPLQRATLVTPPGNAGNADVVVSSANGTATLTRGFAYLQNEQIFTKAGFYKFIIYDQKRQRLYLSNIDHVDVFDLASGQFLSAIQPPGGPPPNAGLRGLALTPDSSQIVVADFGAQSVYLINPDTSSGSATFVGGIPGFVNSGPSRVATTSAQTVFVGVSAEGNSQTGCTSCLGQMNISSFPPTIAPASQPEISFLTGSPLLQSNSSGDHVFFSFPTASGGPIASWDAAAPGEFQTWIANSSAVDLAVSADGNTVGVRENAEVSLRANNLSLIGVTATRELERIPGRTEVPGAALHASGSLLYLPFLAGPAPTLPPVTGVTGGIDIVDARTGILRRRIFLPEPLAMLSADVDGQHGSFIALDENGQRIFALTNSGLTLVQLASVPLGVGSLAPASGSSSGGTIGTLRGSGFQSGTKVSIGGKNATANFKDMNTLNIVTPALTAGPQQIVVTNPSGESVTLDAGFTAN